MNKLELTIDEQINTSNSYRNRVLQAINERKRSQFPRRKTNVYRKMAITCVCLCFIAASGVGVNAAINYEQKRMEQISDTEKQHYLDSVNESLASADSYSRELTEQEKSRMDQLVQEYLSKGVYPNQSILEINDSSEIISSRICFMPSTSTFYLPESTLIDEDLLELIDFYNIRDNTLNSQKSEQQYDMSGVEGITEDNAVEAAKSMVKRLYDVDINDMDIEIDYQQGTDGDEFFSTDYVYFVNKLTGEKYNVTVNMQNGRIECLEKMNESSFYSGNMKADETQYEDQYVMADQMATSFLNNDNDWKLSKITYNISDDGIVKNGVVNYEFVAQCGDCCIVSYSQAMQQIYKVRYFTEVDILEKRNEKNEPGINLKSIQIN